MSLDTLIILAGVLIAVIPFLGFTVAMQMWIIFFLGLVVVGLGIAVRRSGARHYELHHAPDGFVESKPRRTRTVQEPPHRTEDDNDIG